MNRGIEAHLSECRPCATFQEKQPTETLLNDPVSTKPWNALAMNNFNFNGKHYLIVVDHFSKFIAVKHSQDLTSRTTINILLDIFSGHGHHSRNPAENAVKTVKSLVKQCLAGNTSRRIALLEYLSTPLGPNIPSPSELISRQFRGILPFFQDHGATESVKE